MKNNIKNSFTGYIEGYYGKLLSWSQRRKIINKLSHTSLSFYLYAPKGDLFHRQNWRVNYSSQWLKSFQSFSNYSKKKNISIIAGISPGLDISFQKDKIEEEIILLAEKANVFLQNGADEIAILFDDIPKNKTLDVFDLKTDGSYHAMFTNKLGQKLKKSIFVVPKIYALELNHLDPLYIDSFSKNIHTNHKIFFCGKNIVARKKLDLSFLPKLKNKIIIWDNIFANDYCPKKLVIGPWKHREGIKNIMINPTGLIETDLLILDLISLQQKKVDPHLAWSHICKKHNIPCQIKNLEMFFDPYRINNEQFNPSKEDINQIIHSIDKLLWEWHSPLSREWYPYLFNLKQDMIIAHKNPTKKNIFKTQTIPFSSWILKN